MVFQTNETHKLQVIRGTTKVIRVTIRDAAGNLYTPREGDIVRFGVKISSDSTRYLIERETAEIADSAVLFRLSPEDTAALDLGQYRYDVGVQSGQDYFNVIPHSTFAVLPNITGKKPTDAEGGIEDVVELTGTIETVPTQTGGAYVLPVATPETLGGVKPVAKTDAMTQEVGVNEEGRLFTALGGGGAEEWELAAEFTTTEDVATILQDLNGSYKKIRYIVKLQSNANSLIRVAVNGKPSAADRGYISRLSSATSGVINGEFDIGSAYVTYEGNKLYLSEYGALKGSTDYNVGALTRETKLVNENYSKFEQGITAICIYNSGSNLIKAGASCIVYGVRA